jgi:hypothetical protein
MSPQYIDKSGRLATFGLQFFRSRQQYSAKHRRAGWSVL